MQSPGRSHSSPACSLSQDCKEGWKETCRETSRPFLPKVLRFAPTTNHCDVDFIFVCNDNRAVAAKVVSYVESSASESDLSDSDGPAYSASDSRDESDSLEATSSSEEEEEGAGEDGDFTDDRKNKVSDHMC
jgi:hypothetical protein